MCQFRISKDVFTYYLEDEFMNGNDITKKQNRLMH